MGAAVAVNALMQVKLDSDNYVYLAGFGLDWLKSRLSPAAEHLLRLVEKSIYFKGAPALELYRISGPCMAAGCC